MWYNPRSKPAEKFGSLWKKDGNQSILFDYLTTTGNYDRLVRLRRDWLLNRLWIFKSYMLISSVIDRIGRIEAANIKVSDWPAATGASGV